MKLSDALEKLKFDTRMVHWNMQNKLVSKNEIEQHLQQLPDVSQNGEAVQLDMEAEEPASLSDV